jgi:hypothetical protein
VWVGRREPAVEAQQVDGLVSQVLDSLEVRGVGEGLEGRAAVVVDEVDDVRRGQLVGVDGCWREDPVCRAAVSPDDGCHRRKVLVEPRGVVNPEHDQLVPSAVGLAHGMPPQLLSRQSSQ